MRRPCRELIRGSHQAVQRYGSPGAWMHARLISVESVMPADDDVNSLYDYLIGPDEGASK